MADNLECERCGGQTPEAVFKNTAGICRKCQKTIPKPVTIEDIRRCLEATDKRYNSLYFEAFCRRKPSRDAFPLLQQGLHLGDHVISKMIAKALRKVGTHAAVARKDLLAAACHLDPHGMPQAYPECLDTLVAIDKSSPELIPLIQRFTHICNWNVISASMKALVEIETQEATAELKKLHLRWSSEFDQRQLAIADRLLHEAITNTG